MGWEFPPTIPKGPDDDAPKPKDGAAAVVPDDAPPMPKDGAAAAAPDADAVTGLPLGIFELGDDDKLTFEKPEASSGE